MNVRINSPVLLPFGHDIKVIKILSEIGKEIYVAPQYKFWGKRIELCTTNYPTRYGLDYIKQKINDDYTGVIKYSKYKNLFFELFNNETAKFMDIIYQIKLDQKHKDILLFLLTTEIEKHIDDVEGFKKVNFNLRTLNYIIDNANDYFDLVNLKNLRINIIDEKVKDQQFGSIFDSIYRKSRLYNPHYLGVINLFSGEKENISKWDWRLGYACDANLIQGGTVVLYNYPSEYVDKINNILNELKFKKLTNNIWKKPDIKVKKITKGIKRYF